MDPATAQAILMVLKSIGPLGVLLICMLPVTPLLVQFYFAQRAEAKRWQQSRADSHLQADQDRQERAQQRAEETTERERDRTSEREARDKDRAEHMAKWDSMVKSHGAETDRLYRLFERQTQAIELQAHLLTVLQSKIEHLTKMGGGNG